MVYQSQTLVGSLVQPSAECYQHSPIAIDRATHGLVYVGHEINRLQHTLKPNSITLCWSQAGPKLVADLQRAGIWPII